MISCFWEGQEGSFLLWIFWNCVIGLVFIKNQKTWEAPVMTIFGVIQFFLSSMILGVVILDLKLGSSPFLLLKEFMTDAPIFKMQPDFIPKDGTGLNPLLQNPWMVIHPPTLFLGFALTTVPFAFCISGLWMGKYSEWIKPALPWALFCAAVLGLGILMGGYWAYETLNFGGYWNWDPVENAVYVPWLVLIAAIHSMIIYHNNQKGLKAAIVLSVAAFLLILYSTFMTRSGILGNASVHSFTDLGLSGQLLIYLLSFVAITIVSISKIWKKLPGKNEEINALSRDFWILMGVLVICMAAFQIILTTSIPVYNTIMNNIGFKTSVALPADQVAHYSKYQLWFSVFIALLSGTGQFFFWKKMEFKKVSDVLYLPVILTMIVTTIILYFAKITNWQYIVLLVASLYSLIANSIILVQMIKKAPMLSGGSLAHIGIAMMFIGVLFSSGYSKIVSQNQTGMLYSKEFNEQMNRENVLLWRNQKSVMNGYDLLYKGPRVEARECSDYLDKEKLESTASPNKAILKETVMKNGLVVLKKGDTITYQPENTFFEIEFRKDSQTAFTIYPRAQVNAQMGGLLASPDIKKMFGKDLYAHVSSMPDPEKETKWNEEPDKEISLGDTFLVNDYYSVLKGVTKIDSVPDVPLGKDDIAIRAVIQVFDKNQTHYLEPIFVIKDNLVGMIPDVNKAIGVRAMLKEIHPDHGHFVFSFATTQKDWVIIKAMEKPLIDLLWLGSLLVLSGFGVALARRSKKEKPVLNS